MSDKKDKNRSTEEQEHSAPQVNEKVKYYLIAIVAILAVVSALLVIYGPDVDAKEIVDATMSYTYTIHK